MLKRFRQTVAMLLVLSIALYLWPMSVYAEISQKLSMNNRLTADESSDLIDAWERGIYELTERRTENVKHFLLPDGSITAVMYSVPVHYADENGTWHDIDNTLSLAQNEYSTSNQRIKFAKKITGNESLFTLHDGNGKITLSLNGARKKATGAATVTSTYSNEQPAELQKLIDLERLSSRILYADILDGVDIEYVAESMNLKENIIIKRTLDDYSFEFTLALNNLSASITETGSVRIYNESGKNVYVIPKGYMYDANGKISTDVEYALEYVSNGKYTLTVTADKTWINAEERAFPVTVDPTLSQAVQADSMLRSASCEN